mgnify:CR=1 FL=1
MIDCEFCHLTVSKSNYSKHKKTDLCKNINTVIKNNIKENDTRRQVSSDKDKQQQLKKFMIPAKALDVIARTLESSRLFQYQPYDWQKEYHAKGESVKERALFAGNRVGKTFCAARECA